MADDGAGMVKPCSAGDLKKNMIGLFKGRPAKVMEVRVSKTGKHGHAKCSIVAIDIWSGKKYQDVQPSHASMFLVEAVKKDYQLMHWDKETNDVQVLDDDSTVQTFAMSENDALTFLQENYDENAEDNDFTVTVLSGPEQTGDNQFARRDIVVEVKRSKGTQE